MKIKALMLSLILLILVISWSLLPHSYDLINVTDYLIGYSIPVYPKATNLVRGRPCEFSFTVDAKDLADVKKYYFEKFKSPFFVLDSGRSWVKTHEEVSGTAVDHFQDFYIQRFTLTKGLKISGGIYSTGANVVVKCQDFRFFL